MTARLLPKKDLPGFIAALAKKQEVWAPVRIQSQEAARFSRIDRPEDICLDYLNTKLPVKELFFPQREVMFTFNPGERSSAQASAQVRERVVLGVRPCDAAALELFDKVFVDESKTASPLAESKTAGPLADPYYKERRDKTTLIGLACNAPGQACFCTATDGGPHSTRGLDLLLIDLGDRFLARPVTAKGEALAKGLARAKDKDISLADELAEEARATMDFAIELKQLQKSLDKAFDHEVWHRLSLPCVNCGVCTYVCPACHCFDVTDEEYKDSGARIRTWDSCQFSLFTRHASGHNPRPDGMSRMRNRTLHKFCYFPKTQDKVLCVGCGRCITECPAGIDLRETLETLRDTLS
ncbi:MAG: 4Fe-4S dicluster domain-containing protein [candidate division WOR-3 bacterium]|nr:MAG: 4Fe-4S dicluster domain-containing protein [candidate division WOR-3 bacterium]